MFYLYNCYSVTVLQCYSVTLLQCYIVTVLQCYIVTVLQCYRQRFRVKQLYKYIFII